MNNETTDNPYEEFRDYMTEDEWKSFMNKDDNPVDDSLDGLYEEEEDEDITEEEEDIPECPDYLPFTNGRLSCPTCGCIGTTYIDGTAYCHRCRNWYRYA